MTCPNTGTVSLTDSTSDNFKDIQVFCHSCSYVSNTQVPLTGGITWTTEHHQHVRGPYVRESMLQGPLQSWLGVQKWPSPEVHRMELVPVLNCLSQLPLISVHSSENKL